ncbi:FitA-like ribbon-helix-helix domain-containing protein [Bradyrhizobium prioriisuperbiae]|uniref:FitA-like ribbon-helix-helix domain-containing protein n=1 Tax=Bradyrhizobium prioriisuperbiae TaxID=2854389 RepID=UPI0028E6EFDD|nr:plasmid stabilization protein [Bradyrhizobium prioritasuperba]
MASMIIRNIDEQLKAQLRMRAAIHGRSMEDEARDILRAALATKPREPRNLAKAIRTRIAPTGGVTLQIPSREPIRERVDFSE